MYLVIFKKHRYEKINGYSLVSEEDLGLVKKRAPVKKIIPLDDKLYSKDEIEKLVSGKNENTK